MFVPGCLVRFARSQSVSVRERSDRLAQKCVDLGPVRLCGVAGIEKNREFCCCQFVARELLLHACRRTAHHAKRREREL